MSGTLNLFPLQGNKIKYIFKLFIHLFIIFKDMQTDFDLVFKVFCFPFAWIRVRLCNGESKSV